MKHKSKGYGGNGPKGSGSRKGTAEPKDYSVSTGHKAPIPTKVVKSDTAKSPPGGK